jgi:hypothetical protein
MDKKPMKYLCLIYIDANKLESTPANECLAYAASLQQKGQCLAAEALHASRPTTAIHLRNGKLSVTDGPFAETRELLAGFYVLEVADLDEAIQLAAKSPPLSAGRIELRPVLETEVQT